MKEWIWEQLGAVLYADGGQAGELTTATSDTLNALDAFKVGFTRGILLVLYVLLAVIILYVLISLFRRGRKKAREILVQGEKGDLTVTVHAVRQFLTRVLCEFREVSLRSLVVRERGSGVTLTLEVEAVANAVPISLREQIQERVFQEVGSKLGITDRLRKVNVRIPDWDADQVKINKAREKAVGSQPEALPPYEAEETDYDMGVEIIEQP
ncbi:MAG: hypothetical protein HN742_06440 [Lentisphaerae bacterium]|jgi:hypothetical protein|nr:hypothetical protein [Lentisphaerota bacterium]MBT4819961.1 hypothetical protein [Lentisphaerota bacterium]MBT5610045.1 hypothetical protein [Lentisphaerota bacterium]MBT7055555.1 hypothetical protein [Lentisphaerota bacterium]MBT7841490.1 hypothetical protein [Lentisphaerota bacterium]